MAQITLDALDDLGRKAQSARRGGEKTLSLALDEIEALTRAARLSVALDEVRAIADRMATVQPYVVRIRGKSIDWKADLPDAYQYENGMPETTKAGSGRTALVAVEGLLKTIRPRQK